MSNDRRPKKLLDWTPERRKRGRPRKTWIEAIRNTVAQRNLKVDNNWKDRKVWKLGYEKRL